VVDDVAAGDQPAIRVTIEAVGLLELHALRDVGEISAVEIVDSGHIPAQVAESFGDIAAEEARHAGDKHFQLERSLVRAIQVGSRCIIGRLSTRSAAVDARRGFRCPAGGTPCPSPVNG